MVFNEDKAGFMAGALAGLLTKTNTVAAVLGTDKIPPVVAYKVGYENGAKHTNPNVKLLSTYHPGGLDKAFIDPEWGAQTSKQALDNGADVVFGAGGKTGNGALEEVAKKSGAVLHRRGQRPVGHGPRCAPLPGDQRHEAHRAQRRRPRQGCGRPAR